MKLFDKENKGFLDFKTFSAHVTPNMSRLVNVQKNEVHLPNLVPNKDKNLEYGNKANQLLTVVNEARKNFSPDLEQSNIIKSYNFVELVAPTRFSSKPIPTNTFLNF